MQKTFTTITGADFYDSLVADAADGATEWSINKNAASGDTVLFYVCRPVSAIVAVATIIEKPYLEMDVSSVWYGKYFTEMENLRMLTEPLSRSRLLSEFPDWIYWKQPRNSIVVRTEFQPKLEAILNIQLTA